MSHDPNRRYLEQESWLDCIGDLISKSYIISTEDPSYSQDPVFLDTSNSISITNKPTKSTLTMSTETQATQLPAQQENYIQKMTQQNPLPPSQKTPKRPLNTQQDPQNEQQSSKQQSRQSQKQSRGGKQSQYSKSYRQRKKEQMKSLQQQNSYLKQKINQLQNRLREKELQINRLKHPPAEKQFSVEQLNEEFLKKTNLMLSKTSIDPVNYGKTVYSPQDTFYYEFMNSYDERGFGGRLKKNTLNYYFNELLQSVIRDSEKYLFLVCNHFQDPSQITGLQTYEQIDLAFHETMQLDQDKKQRITFFAVNLHTFMRQLKQICTDFCTNFNRILSFLDKVHNFMKSAYPTNMDFARKRIQLENWFEHNKHSKLIRRLRSEWLDFIKKAAQDQQDEKNNLKGKKKKKKADQKLVP